MFDGDMTVPYFLWGTLGFLALWPVSLLRRDASVVDFWWGPGIGVMALAAWMAPGGASDAHGMILFGLTAAWALRLGLHLGWRRLHEGEEDGRYQDLRRHWSPGWWWKSLLLVFVLQALLQVLVAAGALAGVRAAAVDFSALSLMATVVALFGLGLQTLADVELDRFRARGTQGTLLTTGTRAIVRHPNYSGEILFWGAIAVLAMERGVIWAPLSALLVFGLLRYVSGVPVIEGRMLASRPDFENYRARTPALVPRLADLWPSRGTSGDRA